MSAIAAAAPASPWRVLLQGARAAHVVFHIGTGFALAFVTGGFFRAQPDPRVRRATRWWLGRLTRILNVETVVVGMPSPQAALYVANHVSWLDIPVLGGEAGVYFLSKAEVGNWPLIGRLATVAGTLYIRRGHGQVRERTRQIAAHIAGGRSVLVFPEGTTTDGADVRAFHAPLFAAVGDGLLQPVAIRYFAADGTRHALVPFIGDDEFTTHLWRLLACDRIRAEVHFLPPVSGQAAEPRELADQTWARVRGVVAAV